MKQKLIDTIWVALAVVAIAVVLATGSRLVSWMMGDDVAGIWKLTLALIGGAGVAGVSTTAVRRRNGAKHAADEVSGSDLEG